MQPLQCWECFVASPNAAVFDQTNGALWPACRLAFRSRFQTSLARDARHPTRARGMWWWFLRAMTMFADGR